MRRISAPPKGAPDDLEGAAGDIRIISRVAPYLWPEGEGWAKRRVVLALILLVVAKGATVITPFFYKAAVDALAPEEGAEMSEYLLLAGPIGLVVAYGMTRLFGVVFQQRPPSTTSTRCRCATISGARPGR
jgi:ATP-binding cassette subfamily B protein